MKSEFKALLVTEDNGNYKKEIVTLNTDDLSKNDLLIKVEYSSINYKDALSSSGNRGVTKQYPHVPGVDAVGTVIESISNKIPVASKVLVTGYDLGMNTWGGLESIFLYQNLGLHYCQKSYLQKNQCVLEPLV